MRKKYIWLKIYVSIAGVKKFNLAKRCEDNHKGRSCRSCDTEAIKVLKIISCLPIYRKENQVCHVKKHLDTK